jgi:hypothetical protein
MGPVVVAVGARLFVDSGIYRHAVVVGGVIDPAFLDAPKVVWAIDFQFDSTVARP